MIPAVYHYTCRHAWEQIGDTGTLVPARFLTDRLSDVAWWPASFVWLTDLVVPIRDAIGLTSHLVTCDRTEFRYRVTDTTNVQKWTTVRRTVTDPDILETARPGARPAHWYVSSVPVPVVLDDVRR